MKFFLSINQTWLVSELYSRYVLVLITKVILRKTKQPFLLIGKSYVRIKIFWWFEKALLENPSCHVNKKERLLQYLLLL